MGFVEAPRDAADVALRRRPPLNATFRNIYSFMQQNLNVN
jgi:hypothetical protein